MDYRKLNLVTKADPYPIPRIKDMIDNIGQASYITALDLTMGYWQVPVAKARQEKTAFVSPWGKYQFVTMPFGLVHISASDGPTARRNTRRLLRLTWMMSSYIADAEKNIWNT